MQQSSNGIGEIAATVALQEKAVKISISSVKYRRRVYQSAAKYR